jgi:ApaG protein
MNVLPLSVRTSRACRHDAQSPAGTAGTLGYDDFMSSSEAVTRGIRVQVAARYSPDHSHPSSSRWFFLYTVTIANQGDETVQLVSRHWIITDAAGQVEEVRGPGVVGQQPVLEPGQSFEYTSGCPLSSPYGAMRGTYQMVSASGARFDAEIAEFELRGPYVVH